VRVLVSDNKEIRMGLIAVSAVQAVWLAGRVSGGSFVGTAALVNAALMRDGA